MKTYIFLFLTTLLFFSGCEKKYDIDDISSFELKYFTGSGESGYFYSLQINENGELDIQSRKPLSDSTRHSVYTIDSTDLANLKPMILNFINSDINKTYGDISSQASDYPATGISLKSNKSNVQTTIYQVKESDLPESVKNILATVSALQSKYDI
jgi:hypothetical protein